MSGIQAIIFAIFLLALNGFFVAAEFSLISSRKDRIDALIAQGKTRAKKVEYATEHLSIMLAGAQLGITIASLLLGKVGEPAIAHLLERPFGALGVPESLLHAISFAIALAVITFLHILVGEMVPKNIALAGPETLAMILVPAHILFVKMMLPILNFMNWVARHTLRLFGIEQKDELDSAVDTEQLAIMVSESRSEGLLDAEEHARLAKALRTDKRSVREVLIRKEDVHAIPFGERGPTVQQLEEAVNETGYSRFPITGATGNYLGYVHIKDVLDRLASSRSSQQDVIPRSQIRQLINIDASGVLDQTLRRMRSSSAHMAQVRDRGQLIGVITLEDLIEEYVGNVRDWTHEDTADA
ncbi:MULTISPECIES: hemolysin family protein [Corynebacterium]|uniref:hemolysin family protein n=1 Tax=Corynebacterium TaxID=1716 RepID=UPI00124C69CB|nr:MULTISPECIES: hemolysin family protein [Corynebacterium]